VVAEQEERRSKRLWLKKKIQVLQLSKLLQIEQNLEDVEEKEEKAHLHYNLYAPHPNAKVLAGKSAGRDTKKACKARNVRQKMVDLSELEASELENSIHLEEETYKPSRDFKYSYLKVYYSKAQISGFVWETSSQRMTSLLLAL